MSSFPQNVGPGLFLPTTEIIDTSFINNNDNLGQDIKEILIRIVQALNESNNAVNLKDTGIYTEQEFVNGQVYFPNPALSSTTAQNPVQRQVFRTVINFGALPNAANKAVAHGLTFDANTIFTRIYGAASNTTGNVYIPIPQTIIAGGGNIDLRVTAANVNVRTTFNATAYNECYIVLEYIKQ